MADVSAYKDLFSRFTSFEGKTVLDLGCNTGYLLHSFRQQENFKAIGADIVDGYLNSARQQYPEITFVKTTARSIPLPDNSVDIIYTIDTVEHLTYVEQVFQEAHRVLKPNGLFLVHFNPWLNPYGSHLEDIIAFPWPHVVFSMNTLLNTAERVYELSLIHI